MAGMSSYLPQIDNGMRWKRAVTGHGFTVIMRNESLNVHCVKAIASRNQQAFVKKSVSSLSLPTIQGSVQSDLLADFEYSIYLYSNAGKWKLPAICNLTTFTKD